MGFLDNLENSLKSLEEREERDPAEYERREQKRSYTLAAAPWAAKLKAAPYTQALFEQATLAGHRLRTKVYMSWFDDVLALQAKDRKLELRPTPEGSSQPSSKRTARNRFSRWISTVIRLRSFSSG